MEDGRRSWRLTATRFEFFSSFFLFIKKFPNQYGQHVRVLPSWLWVWMMRNLHRVSRSEIKVTLQNKFKYFVLRSNNLAFSRISANRVALSEKWAFLWSVVRLSQWKCPRFDNLSKTHTQVAEMSDCFSWDMSLIVLRITSVQIRIKYTHVCYSITVHISLSLKILDPKDEMIPPGGVTRSEKYWFTRNFNLTQHYYVLFLNDFDEPSKVFDRTKRSNVVLWNKIRL